MFIMLDEISFNDASYLFCNTELSPSYVLSTDWFFFCVLIWTFKQNFWLLENAIILIFKDGCVDLILFWFAVSFLAFKRLFSSIGLSETSRQRPRIETNLKKCLISGTSFIIHYSSVTWIYSIDHWVNSEWNNYYEDFWWSWSTTIIHHRYFHFIRYF